MNNRNEMKFNNTNFNGPNQNVNGDVNYNYYSDLKSEQLMYKYETEPVWRSPITMGILTWLSAIISLISLIPIGRIVMYILKLLKGNLSFMDVDLRVTIIVLAILIILVFILLSLRNLTKKQLRKPLFMGLAISGKGEKITFEKIHSGKCPLCGGKMRYYNKTAKWRDVHYSDGKTKREVLEKKPALECQRNADHFAWVDPAEDAI